MIPWKLFGTTNLTHLATQFHPVVRQAETSSKEVVDYVFWKGVLLVCLALAAGLIYRLLGRHLARAPGPPGTS